MSDRSSLLGQYFALKRSEPEFADYVSPTRAERAEMQARLGEWLRGVEDVFIEQRARSLFDDPEFAAEWTERGIEPSLELARHIVRQKKDHLMEVAYRLEGGKP